MELVQNQNLNHGIVLTQAMRQSLACLQMAAPELNAYLQEASLSNPLLEYEAPQQFDAVPLAEIMPDAGLANEIEFRASDHGYKIRNPVERAREIPITVEKSLAEYLDEQLGQMRFVDGRLRQLCRYLIGCLDSRGYLDCSVQELAGDLACDQKELNRALSVLQTLDPAGVAARSLSECLILQLSREKQVDPLALAIVSDGLELLSRRDYPRLAKKLCAEEADVRGAAETVLSLNPIPSRGFAGLEPIPYAVPEAKILHDTGRIVVEVQERYLAHLEINRQYATVAETTDDPEVRRYIRENLSQAQDLIRSLETRRDTLLRVITHIVETQREFFCGSGQMIPATMQKTADAIGVNVSTVSRAVQNKYVEFEGKVLPLRSLFASALHTDTAEVTTQTVKQKLLQLIRQEDQTKPFSDELLCTMLSQAGIQVSRRTVAKYRIELGIETSAKRKRLE